MGVASERLNGVKQSGSRTIREPTWYFQSKLLVSYKRKDNMLNMLCQDRKVGKKYEFSDAIIPRTSHDENHFPLVDRADVRSFIRLPGVSSIT